MNLDGHVMLITGARRGIGYAIADQAAGAGARVIIHAREQAQAEEAASRLHGPHPASAVWGDLSQVDMVRQVVDAAGRVHGRLDALVNNAGFVVVGPAADLTEAEWELLWGVNVRAVFFACQAAFPLLRQSSTPRIVNISSQNADTAVPGRAAYAASRAAVSHLTRTLAIEWAPYGITVNAVAPGFVRTERMAPILSREGPEIVARTPLGRIAEPDEIAAAVMYLLSEQARHVTGQVIRIDGGWVLFGGWRPPAHDS